MLCWLIKFRIGRPTKYKSCRFLVETKSTSGTSCRRTDNVLGKMGMVDYSTASWKTCNQRPTWITLHINVRWVRYDSKSSLNCDGKNWFNFWRGGRLKTEYYVCTKMTNLAEIYFLDFLFAKPGRCRQTLLPIQFAAPVPLQLQFVRVRCAPCEIRSVFRMRVPITEIDWFTASRINQREEAVCLE